MSKVQSLEDVFRRYRGIQAVYVFGSIAAGMANRESDLDLAIISVDRSLKEKKAEILGDLTRLGYCNVDFVFLDEDDLVLAYEVVRQNRLIYAAAGVDRGATHPRIVRKYLGFTPYLGIQRDAYKRRIAGA